jgi:hypothetical protein
LRAKAIPALCAQVLIDFGDIVLHGDSADRTVFQAVFAPYTLIAVNNHGPCISLYYQKAFLSIRPARTGLKIPHVQVDANFFPPSSLVNLLDFTIPIVFSIRFADTIP